MHLYHVIWKSRFVEKMAAKHGVTTEEVEQVLFSKPHVRVAERGRVKGEDLYVAYGETYGGQTPCCLFHPQAANRCVADFSSRHDPVRTEILQRAKRSALIQFPKSSPVTRKLPSSGMLTTPQTIRTLCAWWRLWPSCEAATTKLRLTQMWLRRSEHVPVTGGSGSAAWQAIFCDSGLRLLSN